MSDQTARVGRNEALFREVNERIDKLHDDLGSSGDFEIVCECGAASCTERFAITSEAYRFLRENARRFAVIPGHERPDVERTVGRESGYLVVEKTDPDAARAAEEMA